MATLERLSYEGDADMHGAMTMTASHNEPDVQRVPIKKLSEEFDNCFRNCGPTIGISSSSTSLSTSSTSTSEEPNHMNVFLRIRPIATTNNGGGVNNNNSTISVVSDTTISTFAPTTSKRAMYTKKEERSYTFNQVFGPTSLQSDVFQVTTLPLVERFVAGDNSLLFAYGMTNAGKTHTIQGQSDNLDKEGIFPRLIKHVLNQIPNMTNPILHISMLEIYQEKIFDLLSSKKEKLSIRDGNGRVEVAKLSTHPISSVEDVNRLLVEAAGRRAKSQTLLNAGSSRSHAVYTVTLQRTVNENNGSRKEMTSVFQVVDLAGAERGNRTKGTVTQQKEANNINMSLMQLWRCLQSMKKSKTTTTTTTTTSSSDPMGATTATATLDTTMIPFRESKLTHLLMPVLCRAGLNGVAMIACVNPVVDDYDETISILSNASLACRIKELAEIGRVMTASTVPTTTTTTTTGVNVSAIIESFNAKELTKKRKQDIATNTTKATGKSKKASLTNVLEQQIAVVVTSDDDVADEIPPSTARNNDDNNHNNGDALHENKRLRSDVLLLTNENEQLKMMLLLKEQTVRMELSKEMKQRTTTLMNNIKQLQQQLHQQQHQTLRKQKQNKKSRRNNSNNDDDGDNEDNNNEEEREDSNDDDDDDDDFDNDVNAFDITKSVRKIRKRQLAQTQQQDNEDLLKEAEMEIERIKQQHETDMLRSQQQLQQLERELKEWKAKAERFEKELRLLSSTAATSTTTMPSLSTIEDNSSSTIVPTTTTATATGGIFTMSLPPSRAPMRSTIASSSATTGATTARTKKISIASEFTKRMQRDVRFQLPANNNNNDENNNNSGAKEKKPLSPVRSPLSPVHHDANIVPVVVTDSGMKKQQQQQQSADKPVIDRSKLVMMANNNNNNNSENKIPLRKLRSHIRV